MMRLLIILFGLIAVLVAISLCIGAAGLPPVQTWSALIGHGPEAADLVVWQLRLPRTLLALFIGVGLGASGAALQGLLRNPLADPAVVGISSSASLFAVAAIYSGITANHYWILPMAALFGAGLAAAILLVLNQFRVGVTGLILGGVALGAMATSFTALLMNLSPNPWALSEIAYWLMGSVADRSFTDLALAAPLILLGVVVLLFAGKGLNALTLGEDMAQTRGFPVAMTGAIVVAGTALATGAGVAVSGAIGFVGLAAPHMVRPLLGHEPGRAILPAALAGGAMLLAADIAVRLFSGPGQPLYLGVVTALIGAPFFIYLVLRWQRERA